MIKKNVDSIYSRPSLYVSNFFQMNTCGKCQKFEAKVGNLPPILEHLEFIGPKSAFPNSSHHLSVQNITYNICLNSCTNDSGSIVS